MLKVLLVDDDRELCAMQADYLAADGFAVSCAYDGEAGAAAALAGDFSIVVLDVMMPRQNGMDTLRRIREHSDVPVIMLTARGDEAEILRGFAAGADDYVTKPFSFAQLAARITAVVERTSSGRHPSEVIHGADLEVDTIRHRVLRAGQPVELTPTEFSILVTLMRQAGRVLSARQIVTEVWGSEYMEETGYIRRYVWHLRQKLEVDPRQPRYVLNERGIGYLFPAVD